MPTSIATLDALLDELSDARESFLFFSAPEGETRPGYHLTEIKLNSVRSIDCGRGTDAWSETVIELLDGPADGVEPDMTAGKFLRISAAGLQELPEIGAAPLYVEFGPANRPVRRYRVGGVDRQDGRTVVRLVGVHAACKPRLRLARAPAQAAAPAATCC